MKISGGEILGFCSLDEQLDRAKRGFIYLFFMTDKFTLLTEDSSIKTVCVSLYHIRSILYMHFLTLHLFWLG